jgi:hypothetical protein
MMKPQGPPQMPTYSGASDYPGLKARSDQGAWDYSNDLMSNASGPPSAIDMYNRNLSSMGALRGTMEMNTPFLQLLQERGVKRVNPSAPLTGLMGAGVDTNG